MHIAQAKVKTDTKTGTGLLTGRTGIFAAAFTWQAALASRGFRVHNVDCAMRFNAFALADEAMARGLQPEGLLQEIKVQRAFTPYQTLDALHAILDSKARNKRFHFLLAPCKQFFDGDVNRDEGAFLLNKMFSIIALMRAESVPVIFVEKNIHGDPRYETAVQRLRSVMDTVWELAPDNEIKTLRNNNPPTLSEKTRNHNRSRHNGQNPASLFHAAGSRGGTLQPI